MDETLDLSDTSVWDGKKFTTVTALLDALESEREENERLREALRQVEQFAMRNIQAGIREGGHIVRMDECLVCRAPFHSDVEGEKHRDDCPFKLVH